MLFSSSTFLFLFLPVLCLVYLCSKKELHNAILLVASLIFYGWGEPKYLAIMILCIIINYFGAIAIEKFRCKKVLLIVTVLLNLSFLIYFKYFNFIFENINNLFHSHISILEIVMPIGISFYTFQALSYIFDCYRGEVFAQKNIYKLALYICLFPQLIAGPIVKYHDIESQIDSREVNFDNVSDGVKRFIVGLSKKVLIANALGLVADRIFSAAPDAFSTTMAWIGAICYTFQIYFDFSGYSDMAIGLGLIFGFRFLENFNYPYISKSVTEFWRRWHISLSTWFKEYLYIPLGGNKKGKNRQIFNLFIVFLVTGVWHGASWNFVIWGLWSAIFIVLEKILNRKCQNNTQKVFAHVYCILFFVIGWVIFRAENMAYAVDYLKNMFGLIAHDSQINYISEFGLYEKIILVVAVICSLPLYEKFKNLLSLNTRTKKSIYNAFVNILLLLLFILSAASIAANTYNPFIYFRF